MEGEIVIIHPYAHKQETMKITNVYGLGALTLLIALPIASEEPTSHQSTYLNTIAVGKQSPQLRSQLQPPEHNQTMDQVIGMLGDPKQIYTIGQPVITRWSYGNMTVYFEGDRVLRTVVHNPELETTSVATQQQ